MIARILTFLIALVAASGCATTPDYGEWVSYQEKSQHRASEMALAASTSCETDLCRYLIAKEAGAALRPIEPPRPQQHPAWALASQIVGVGLPAAAGYYSTRENTRLWTGVVGEIAGMDRSFNDHSTHVGGNLGDTDHSTHVGGNFGDTDQSTHSTASDGGILVQGDGNVAGPDAGHGHRQVGEGHRIDSPDDYTHPPEVIIVEPIVIDPGPPGG